MYRINMYYTCVPWKCRLFINAQLIEDYNVYLLVENTRNIHLFFSLNGPQAKNGSENNGEKWNKRANMQTKYIIE